MGRKRLRISFAKKEHHQHDEVRTDYGVTGKVRSPRPPYRLGWGVDCNSENLERADTQCEQSDLAQAHDHFYFPCKAYMSLSSFMGSEGHLTSLPKTGVPLPAWICKSVFIFSHIIAHLSGAECEWSLPATEPSLITKPSSASRAMLRPSETVVPWKKWQYFYRIHIKHSRHSWWGATVDLWKNVLGIS